MPGMDGFDLLRRVKSATRPSSDRLTGYAPQAEHLDSSYGADEYLSKPFQCTSSSRRGRICGTQHT